MIQCFGKLGDGVIRKTYEGDLFHVIFFAFLSIYKLVLLLLLVGCPGSTC